MSFRKRSLLINGSKVPSASRPDREALQGTRPSPLDGRPTTSTGTASLDQLLVGHAGMPMGSSLLIEESGTTDFGGVILRYFAGEGLVQGHDVHVVGFGDNWRREIPGLKETKDKANLQTQQDIQKMKIAWRYDSLGNQASTSGLCKWIEILFDGVVELVPLPKSAVASHTSEIESNKAQGLVRFHAMPVFHEKGGGLKGSWKREEMAFRLSASSGILISPFSLPPVGVEEPPPAPSRPLRQEDLKF
ncbi:hypothetical protein E4U42_006506 [Claviceps africana]|uniref:Elongator complex protein 4 n=1 Tax=Claviceps africana TaxID=83212 RepID=A0A8K0JBC6_9HYPO|nr:hypothetical protein E4U42_006506 [Claviceps africana]